MPRSKTTETFQGSSQSGSSGLDVPKPIPRNLSTGNISAKATAEQPLRPPRTRDSPTNENPPNISTRPTPAPRQSSIEPSLEDPPMPRAPPPVPPSRPQTIAPRGAPPAPPRADLQSESPPPLPSGPCPPVPSRYANIPQSNNLMDTPLSPQNREPTEADPFDTSNIPTHYMSQPLPTVPKRNIESPSNCVPDFSTDNNQISHSNHHEDYSPPSPEFAPPDIPPPSLNFTPNDNNDSFSQSPPKMPPPPPPRSGDLAPANQLPSVPSRPSVNNGLPPVPSRPANLPPVPPRN